MLTFQKLIMLPASLAGTLFSGALSAPNSLPAGLPLSWKQETPACTEDPCAPKHSQLQLLSYDVTKDDKPLSEWKAGEKADITLLFKDAGLKTKDLLPYPASPSADDSNADSKSETNPKTTDQIPLARQASTDVVTKQETDAAKDWKPGDILNQVDADLLQCGFSQPEKTKVVLMSSEYEPLKYAVTFSGVVWNGESNELKYSVGYPSLKIPYTTGSLSVSQAKTSSDHPLNPDTPDVPDSPPAVTPDGSNSGLISPMLPGTDDSNAQAHPENQDDQNPDNPDHASVAAASPNIIIKRYTYGGQEVKAGSEFVLTIDFYNTSKTISVENIVMQVETEEGLSITNASNTYYFERLQPRYSLQQKIGLKALNTDKSTSPTINVTFTYEYVDNDARSSKTSSERISIPVYEPDRMEITEPVIAEDMIAGQEMALSFPYVNKGKSTLYNVTAKVEGDMETLLPVQNLGNFDPGKSGTIDMILTPSTGGEHKFDVVISYEDAAGQEIEKKFPFEVTVMDGMIPDDGMIDFPNGMEEMPENTSGSKLPLILGGLCAAAAAAAGLLFWKNHKKKKTASQQPADADVDYFNDDAFNEPAGPSGLAQSADSPQPSEKDQDV